MALNDIDNIVIVILENRSFDHVLGYLSLDDANPPVAGLEGLRSDPAWQAARANPWAGGAPVTLNRLDPGVQRIDDPPHEHDTIALQIDTPNAPGATPKMDGFVVSYLKRSPAPADKSRVMGYYDARSVPIFDFFARNFAVCDHWFASLPTGTQANRLMAMGGTSSIVDNAPVVLPEQPLVYDWLHQRGVQWCAYQWGDYLPFFTLMPSWMPEIATSLAFSALGGRGRFRRYDKFRQHWTDNGTAMPPVIFIEPEYSDGPNSAPNDDHPPTGIGQGQDMLANIYNTLIANPKRWAKTLLLVTYDEHGGFFDHVPPVPLPCHVNSYLFQTTGVRVPGLVISPLVAPGRVYSENLDHTSILQLLADRFSPGVDYSPEVATRQATLKGRIAQLLDAAPGVPVRVPAIPAAAAAAAQQIAMAGSAPAPAPSTPGAAANARAFHNAAMKLAREHPDLVAGPGWTQLAAYVAENAPATAFA